MRLDRQGERRFSGYVGDEWSSLQGVHGGVVAALVVAAAERVIAGLDADPATTLRAATFGYVRGNVVGDLTLDVDVIRQGRSLITTHVTTTQDDRTTTVARLHHSTPWEGVTIADGPAPPGDRPADTVRMAFPPPAHLNNVEAHLHPSTTLLAGADRAEWIAWCRPLEGTSFDSAWLVMFGDYFPPAVFVSSTQPVRAVTIEYSIQIHSAAGLWQLADGEYLGARVHAFEAADGFAVEDGWIHLPDGRLLATMRQTRLAG